MEEKSVIERIKMVRSELEASTVYSGWFKNHLM